MENKNTELDRLAYSLGKIDSIIKAVLYEEEFKMKGLFEEFYKYEKNFENSILKDFLSFIVIKFSKNIR